MEKCPVERGPCTRMHRVGQRVGAQCTGRCNHPPTGKEAAWQGTGAGMWELWWEQEEATLQADSLGPCSERWILDWDRLWNKEDGVGLGPVSGAHEQGRVGEWSGSQSAPGAAEGCKDSGVMPSTLPPCLSRRAKVASGGSGKGPLCSSSGPGVA